MGQTLKGNLSQIRLQKHRSNELEKFLKSSVDILVFSLLNLLIDNDPAQTMTIATGDLRAFEQLQRRPCRTDNYRKCGHHGFN